MLNGERPLMNVNDGNDHDKSKKYDWSAVESATMRNLKKKTDSQSESVLYHDNNIKGKYHGEKMNCFWTMINYQTDENTRREKT